MTKIATSDPTYASATEPTTTISTSTAGVFVRAQLAMVQDITTVSDRHHALRVMARAKSGIVGQRQRVG